ncbi:MAG TPA: hypothetical protein EYN00_03275 [Planctomycetes bacterium]|nr:hypothetical protein [Planctomycetota bacterium]
MARKSLINKQRRKPKFSSRTAFDGRGNYSMGLTDQLVFPEIKIDDAEFIQGMNVCFTIATSDDEKSLFLLKEFGFPFKLA